MGLVIPILEKLKNKVKILSILIYSVGTLHLSIGKLQLLAPNVLNH